MEVDPTRVCELLVGLPEVEVLGVDVAGRSVSGRVETRGLRPACTVCAGVVVVKERPWVELVDLLRSVGRPGWCGESSVGNVQMWRA